MSKPNNNKEKGFISVLILVFATAFLLTLAGLFSLLLLQNKRSQQQASWNYALHIAEAGVNYARWHLNNFPEDLDFSGTYDFFEYLPEKKKTGEFVLQIEPPSACDPYIKIVSQGYTLRHPNTKRTIEVSYGKESLAKYAFLTDSNVWFGEEESLKGPFHSNGGIRMDGTQNALSTSARETYICGPEHGCSSENCSNPCSWTEQGCECPGIWGKGEGGDQGLWQFPVPAVDFESITQDLARLKQEAQANGIYLGSLGLGYHLKFRVDEENNGVVDVYRVTKLKPKVWGYNGDGWVYESNDIDREEFYNSYSLPNNCAPIFVEDNVWVDGIVKGRVTLVAARLPDISANNAKIIINGNIDYADSSSVLGVIAQKDVLIPLYSPDNLTVKATLLAQKGHVYRYYYPFWYAPYNIRNSIEVYGSIISKDVWTFTWVDKWGNVISGYKYTSTIYDSSLTFNPPPYFPQRGEYKFISWEEK
jgi:hypothetical protein